MLRVRTPIPATGDSLGIAVIAIDAVFLTLAAVALALRLWSRRINGQSLCLNDYAVLLAWPFTAGLVVTAVMAVVPGGGGQHEQNVDPAGLPAVLQGYIAADILWVIANTLIKLSILHLYMQIFSMRGFRLAAYTLMAVVVAFALGVVLQQFLICRPFAKNWDPLLPGTCGDAIQAVLGISVVNVAVDLAIIALPMPVLWRLQMATRRKVAITAIFGLGGIICLITTLRIVAAVQFDPLDFTYGLAKLAIWTDLEPTLGITNACLPVIQPALRRLFRVDAHLRAPPSGTSATRFQAGPSRFYKMDGDGDTYALRGGTAATRTLVGTASLEGEGEVGDVEFWGGQGGGGGGMAGIKVRRDWDVREG